MEFMPSKIPFAPPGWTWSRGARFVGKLCIFALVPGLHQMACKRWLLGVLLAVIYIGAEVVESYKPYPLIIDWAYDWNLLAFRLSWYVRYYVWFLLFLDLRYLETRKLHYRFPTVVFCLVALWFLPDRHPGHRKVYVAPNDLLCPDICKDDIVEFDYRRMESYMAVIRGTENRLPARDRLAEGDYVFVGIFFPGQFLSRIVALPTEENCESGKYKYFKPSKYRYYCSRHSKTGLYYDPYLVLGGPEPKVSGPENVPLSRVRSNLIRGVNVRKMANIHDHVLKPWSFGRDAGQMLMLFYDMTGINLFNRPE